MRLCVVRVFASLPTPSDLSSRLIRAYEIHSDNGFSFANDRVPSLDGVAISSDDPRELYDRNIKATSAQHAVKERCSFSYLRL